MREKLRTFSHSWVYDRTNVFILALPIHSFHLKCQSVLFRMMNTSIMGTPCVISFNWNDGALKNCVSGHPRKIVPKNLVEHCRWCNNMQLGDVPKDRTIEKKRLSQSWLHTVISCRVFNQILSVWELGKINFELSYQLGLLVWIRMSLLSFVQRLFTG